MFEQDNSLKEYLKKYDIELVKESNELIILHKGNIVNHPMIKRRTGWDLCVNGFFFGKDIPQNLNVDHLMKCPEFIQNIAYELDDQSLEDGWQNTSKPSVAKFLVSLNDIGPDTFNAELSDIEKSKFFILKGLEYILFNRTGFWDADGNPMIYLREDFNVPAGDIIDIISV